MRFRRSVLCPGSSSFEQHGAYRLTRYGYILVNIAAGAINRETIEAYSAEIAALVRDMYGMPFAMYSDYDAHVLLTQEAEERLGESILDRARAGMCAAALNLSRSNHRSIVAAQLGRLYRNAGVAWSEFDSYEAAKPWLEAQIAAARNAAGL